MTSGHGGLTLLLLGLWRVKTAWQELMAEEQSCMCHGNQETNKQRKEGLGSPSPLQGHALSGKLPSVRPHLLKVPLPTSSTILGSTL